MEIETQQSLPTFIQQHLTPEDEINRCVIIGNISPKVTDEDINSIFCNFGTILNIKQIRSTTIPVVKTNYLIIFEEQDAPMNCKYIENEILVENPIKVFRLDNKQDIRRIEKVFQYEEHQQNKIRGMKNLTEHEMKRLNKTICLKNISKIDEDEIKKLFEECGKIKYIQFHATKKMNTKILIEFETDEGVVKALEKNGMLFHDKQMIVVKSFVLIKNVEMKPIVTQKENNMIDDMLAKLEKKIDEHQTMECEYERNNERYFERNDYQQEKYHQRDRSQSRNDYQRYDDKYERYNERDYQRYDRRYERDYDRSYNRNYNRQYDREYERKDERYDKDYNRSDRYQSRSYKYEKSRDYDVHRHSRHYSDDDSKYVSKYDSKYEKR